MTGEEVTFGLTRTLCPEILRLAQDLDRVAPTELPVLLLGEPGTGKGVAARYVHQHSRRVNRAFVPIDCGAFQDQLLESDLFGHRRGAFTGATEERKGRIRSGDGGTVFLDEIANMSESAQTRLLRAVQEREVVPLGSDKGYSVDVRWIAATNANVFAEDSRFRADLRGRLTGYTGELPPLRKRREDLGILTAFILAREGIQKASISKAAGRLLYSGALTGNIRELENTLIRSILFANDGRIELEHLRNPSIDRGETAQGKNGPTASEDMAIDSSDSSSRRRRPSRETIVATLKEAKGVKATAARKLETSERQLARWIEYYKIRREEVEEEDK